MFTRPIFRQFFSILKSNKGFSITEVMVAAGLLTVVSIGVTSLMTNMQKEQRRNQLLQLLSSKKLQFENAIMNTASWSNTLAASGGSAGVNTHCLVNQLACSTITVWSGSYSNSYQALILRDGTTGGGAVFYDGTAADGSKQGFTETGAPCSTFTTAAAGNDACPIGYRVSWAPQSTSTVNPKVTVYAKMIYNPSDSSPFKTFLNAPASSTTINTKYDVLIDRTATATSKSFFVTYNKAVSASTCGTGGFGACATTFKTFGVAPAAGLGGAYTISSDQFILLDSTVTNAVRIKNIGAYKCNAKSYAFGTNGAYLQLYRTNNTAAVIAGPVSTFASSTSYGYSTLIMDAVIQITQPNTDIVMQQKCDSVPTSGSDATIAQCALGFSGTYSPASAEMATLNCILIE